MVKNHFSVEDWPYSTNLTLKKNSGRFSSFIVYAVASWLIYQILQHTRSVYTVLKVLISDKSQSSGVKLNNFRRRKVINLLKLQHKHIFA